MSFYGGVGLSRLHRGLNPSTQIIDEDLIFFFNYIVRLFFGHLRAITLDTGRLAGLTFGNLAILAVFFGLIFHFGQPGIIVGNLSEVVTGDLLRYLGVIGVLGLDFDTLFQFIGIKLVGTMAVGKTTH